LRRPPSRFYRRVLFPAGFAALVMSGCAGFFKADGILTETDPYFLFRKVREHAAKLGTFEGRASWTAVSEEGGFRGTTHVVLKSPDSLWMKVEGPFGIDMAIVSVTGGRFLLFSPFLKAAYSGDAGGSRIDQLLPLGPAFSKDITGTAGLLIPGDSLLESLTLFFPEKDEYVLAFGTGDRLRIQKKGPVVSRWEKCDSSGAAVWLWEAERFRNRSGLRLPLVIRVNAERGRRLTVFYETVKANPALRKGWCHVPIPEDVETKTL